MAQTLQLLSIISFAVAGVCFVLAVLFWFFFKIPTVIGDLSGRNARKSIARMRAANENTGVKSYKESKTNTARGKLTETMRGMSKETKVDENSETGLLFENKTDKPTAEMTKTLGSETTAILDSQTTALLVDENATAPLNTENTVASMRPDGKKLEMIEEIMLVHTDEVIG